MTLASGEPAFAGPVTAAGTLDHAGTIHNTTHKATKAAKSIKTVESPDAIHFGHYIAGTPEALRLANDSPPAPASVKAIAVHSNIAVSWPLVQGVNHYVAMTSPAGGQCTTTANSCAMFDVPDNTYTVYVVAYGTAGTDSPSAVSPGSPQIRTVSQGVAGTPPVATHSQTPGPVPTTPYPAMNPVPTQTVTFPGTTPFPTSQPITPSPGVGGVNSVPTAPTVAPTFVMPTAAPTFVMPTAAPTFVMPTAAPTFVMPTAAPTFVMPTAAPTIPPAMVIPPTAPTFPGLTPAPTIVVPAPVIGAPGIPLFPGMSTAPTAPGTTPAPTFAVPVPGPTAVVIPTAAPTFVFPTVAVQPSVPTYVPPTAIPTFPTAGAIPTPGPTFPQYAPMPTVAPGFPGLGNLVPVAPAPAPGTILLPPTVAPMAEATPVPQPPLVLPMLPPISGATAGATPAPPTLPPLPLPSGGPTSPGVPQPLPSVTTIPFPVTPVTPVIPVVPVVPGTPVQSGTGAPSAPLSVTATPYTANGAKVSWTAPASAGAGISHYTVVSIPGGLTCDTPDANTTYCIVMGLSNGTTYTFEVVAVGTVGNSAVSSPSGPVAISAIDAPAAVMLTPGDGQLTVSWSTPTTGNAGITGYSAMANPGATNCSTSNPAQLSCVLTGLTNGVLYTVSVVAHKSGGVADSPASPALNGTPGTAPATTAPVPNPTISAGGLQAPTAVAAAGGVGVIGVAWNPSTSSGVAHYTATVSPGGQTCSTPDSTVNECLITGLTGGTPYTVTVMAVGQDGSASLPSTPYGPVAPTTQQ